MQYRTKKCSHFAQEIFGLKISLRGHVTLFDRNKHSSLHNLLPLRQILKLFGVALNTTKRRPPPPFFHDTN